MPFFSTLRRNSAGSQARRRRTTYQDVSVTRLFPPIHLADLADSRTVRSDSSRFPCRRPEDPTVIIAQSCKSKRWRISSSEVGQCRDIRLRVQQVQTATGTRVSIRILPQPPNFRPQLGTRLFVDPARPWTKFPCRNSARLSVPRLSTSGRLSCSPTCSSCAVLCCGTILSTSAACGMARR